jgi:hypothetical protein
MKSDGVCNPEGRGCGVPHAAPKMLEAAVAQKRPRPGIVTLSLKQTSEIAEALGRIGMLGSQRLLADR